MRNLQHFSGYQFYTLCAYDNFVLAIGWPQMTSEWRHVRTILMQNKGLYKNRSPGRSFFFKGWTNFFAWNDVGLPNCCIDFFISEKNRTDNFQKNIPIFCLFLKKFWFFESKRNTYILYNTSRWISFKISARYVDKNGWLIRHFVLLHTGQRCLP